MKLSKKQSQLSNDLASINFELSDAHDKKRSAVIWTIIYSVILLAGFILWVSSGASIFSVIDYIAFVGCLMGAIIVFLIALTLYLHFWERNNTTDDGLIYRDGGIIDLFSFVITAVIICLPCGIIWITIEHIAPLHDWLTATINSPLRYRGMRLLGLGLGVTPYILLRIKYTKANKRIPHLTQLSHYFEQELDYAFEEERTADPTQSESWKKLKAQRRAAEQRKAAKRHAHIASDSNTDCSSKEH